MLKHMHFKTLLQERLQLIKADRHHRMRVGPALCLRSGGSFNSDFQRLLLTAATLVPARLTRKAGTVMLDGVPCRRVVINFLFIHGIEAKNPMGPERRINRRDTSLKPGDRGAVVNGI